MSQVDRFKQYLKKINDYNHAITLLSWDMETKMPKKGAEAHISAITTLSGEAFKLQTGEQMNTFLGELQEEKNKGNLDEVTMVTVDRIQEEYDRFKNMPQELYEHFVETRNKSQNMWQTAKHANDFETMKPYFEEMIKVQKEMAYHMDAEKDAYDVWLNEYEKGIDAKSISALFNTLKEETVPLIEAISKKEVVDESLFRGEFSKESQEAFAHYLLDVIGYQMDAGRLDESEHPFTIGSAPYDVRITTNYDLTDIRPSAFSVIHEGGHAIYEQNINPIFVGTPLATGTSMGIHESQSRFFENIIGRSRAFWEEHYEAVQKYFPQFKQMDVETFYRGNNIVKPSLIRVDADELTYNLHVILRFELERDLFSGALDVVDLPEAWHDKMKAYLGVVPQNHAEGVLQDVHWPGGMFGYFPSYALGNIYGGQFLDKLEAELGSVESLIKKQELYRIREWLGEHIHQYGAMRTPKQIVRGICGSDLDAKPIIDYYTKKYSQIYKL